MTFFSRQELISALDTMEVLRIPAGVLVKCLTIRVNQTGYISAHKDPANTGIPLYAYDSITFNDGELDCMENEEKAIWIYNSSTSTMTVGIMGVIDTVRLLNGT